MAWTIDKTIEGELLTTEIRFKNTKHSDKLWQERLDPLLTRIAAEDTLAILRADPAIQATKAGYKHVGKDPSRYRPSSDSLWRRAIKGKGLYQVNTLVDLNNDLSLRFHLPLGSYDLEQLQPPLAYTVAPAGATYPGIGKAAIDLGNGLALQDQQGFFGSPTADSTRAMITEATTHALVVVYAFGNVDEAAIQATVATSCQEYLDDCTVVAQEIVKPG
ncbi:B3/B4 domain-containing protein [Lacticaseibacillus sp. GG6-2]